MCDFLCIRDLNFCVEWRMCVSVFFATRHFVLFGMKFDVYLGGLTHYSNSYRNIQNHAYIEMRIFRSGFIRRTLNTFFGSSQPNPMFSRIHLVVLRERE